jgi:hypothetical protein
MKFKTTLILVVVFVILLGTVLLLDFLGKSGEDSTNNLVSRSSEDVEKIVFQKEDETIVFQKNESGEWLIQQPLEAKADKYEVNQIAERFSDLRIERVVEEEPAELDKYGIPNKEIGLFYKGGENPVKVLIGEENPLDKTFFAKREDEAKVVLVSSTLKDLLEKAVFDFRQKDIFKFDTNEVSSIRLQTEETWWEAHKEEKDWFLGSPIKALAEKSQIDGILRSLSNIKAKEFLSEDKKIEDLKEFGLEHPKNIITLSMPMINQEIIFSLYESEEEVYATTSVSSKVISVEGEIMSDLKQTIEDLREKKVADFFSWEVDRLKIKAEGIDLIVRKKEDDTWHFESPKEDEADKDKIESFIRNIESLEAEEFIDPPLHLTEYGLDAPQTEIKIWLKESEEKEKEITLLIGAENKETKQLTVKNTRFEYLFKINSETLKELPVAAADWQKKEPKLEEKD